MTVAVLPVVPSIALRPARLYGLLSTFPPTPCGLATFSAALSRGLEMGGAEVGVVRVGDPAVPRSDQTLATLLNDVPGSAQGASRALNKCDIVIIQHDYGLYGGTDGDEVIDIMEGLTVPCVLVAHTVLDAPTPHQRSVLQRAAELAGAVVVMAKAAHDRLGSRFNVDLSKVSTVHHGAVGPDPAYRPVRSGPPLLLSWGLLGPGKGIEWAIDALAGLKDVSPMPRYVVAGRTHPKVLSAEGETYRKMLVERAQSQGLSSVVSFDPTYRDLSSLTHLVQDASIVVLPYDSHDQVTSGVLVDALAAGRPVVATAFPHAVELLASGAGLVVPHGDSAALSAAIRSILTDPALAASMRREAARIGPVFGWGAVAAQYAALADELLAKDRTISV